MHELSLCQAIAEVVKPYADGRHVDIVRVRIGALRQVVPESLTFCWTLVRDYEDIPDAELELEFITAQVRCRSCGQHSTITSQWSITCRAMPPILTAQLLLPYQNCQSWCRRDSAD